MEASVRASLQFLRRNNQRAGEKENENVFENFHGLRANVCYDKSEDSQGHSITRRQRLVFTAIISFHIGIQMPLLAPVADAFVARRRKLCHCGFTFGRHLLIDFEVAYTG